MRKLVTMSGRAFAYVREDGKLCCAGSRPEDPKCAECARSAGGVDAPPHVLRMMERAAQLRVPWDAVESLILMSAAPRGVSGWAPVGVPKPPSMTDRIRASRTTSRSDDVGATTGVNANGVPKPPSLTERIKASRTATTTDTGATNTNGVPRPPSMADRIRRARGLA